jgi:hypothetical protein
MKRDDAEMAPDDDDAVPEETAPKGARSGTQSIERAVTMLRVIASRGRRGMRIAEVASTAGLAQSTCFRMLKSMQSEGLVDKDGHTRKYYLGSLVYELGLLARPRYRLSELCDNAMQALAESTQETVYLSERSGLEAVCTARTTTRSRPCRWTWAFAGRWAWVQAGWRSWVRWTPRKPPRSSPPMPGVTRPTAG